MSSLLDRINDTISFLQGKTSFEPDVAMVLGSGLGGLVNSIDIKFSIAYKDVLNFPVSTVKGHGGKLVFGVLNGRNVVVMQGRFHYYEGYSMEEVTFPIRVMKFLGANSIIISNASGGLNPDYRVGDLMIVRDHINLVNEHPLRGLNDESIGPRFPDQHNIYDKNLISKASEMAKRNNIICHQGVYVGVTGPTFESPAEYNYMRIIGGDAVGMSTVPEVMVANHMAMKIFAISIITNAGEPSAPVQNSHEDVVNVAAAAEPKMTQIIHDLLPLV
jgi:purine-nucleoside phosphorylase